MSYPRCASVCVLACAVVCAAPCGGQAAGRPAIALSLEKAIHLATDPHGDSTLQIAREGEALTRARAIAARANLLPSFEVSAAEQDQTVNPRALGLRFSSPLFTVPNEVGPFNTFDARARLTQNILNMTVVREWQAAKVAREAAHFETEAERAQTAVKVARLYLALMRAQAEAAILDEAVQDAQRLSEAAQRKQQSGEETSLVASRAALNEARARQRAAAGKAVAQRAAYDLIEALHLKWDSEVSLVDVFAHTGEATADAEASLRVAHASRAEFALEERRLEGAHLEESAARLERLPTLTAYADYGVLEGVQTHTAGVALRVPVFDGGRIRAEETRAAAMAHQEEIRRDQLGRDVELAVRKALSSVAAGREELAVAEQSVQQAEEELGRARRRFAAGLTTEEEEMNAQHEVQQARQERLSAQCDVAAARIELAAATGAMFSFQF